LGQLITLQAANIDHPGLPITGPATDIAYAQGPSALAMGTAANAITKSATESRAITPNFIVVFILYQQN